MNQFVAYLSLPRKNGMWTCQFISGKNHLAKKTASIPNKELDAAVTSTAPACELEKSLGEVVAKKSLDSRFNKRMLLDQSMVRWYVTTSIHFKESNDDKGDNTLTAK